MKTSFKIFLLCLPAILFILLPQRAYSQQYQFGYLSYSKALQNMPEYTNAQNALQTLKKKYEEEAQYNEDKFKKMFADYLQGQKNFPEQIMLKRQKELQVAMEQGINFRQDAQRLLTNAENNLVQPIRHKLDSILARIGNENGLLLIANTDNNNVPFFNIQSGKDITEIVLARINGRVIPVNTPNTQQNIQVPKPSTDVPSLPENTENKETTSILRKK